MPDVSMNRPVHLGRRDQHYKKALTLLNGGNFTEPLSERLWRVDKLIGHLEAAYQEGLYAMRGLECDREEENFLKVLELVWDCAKAVQAMVRHENLLDEDKSFLNEFLGESIDKITGDEETYKERAKDILKGIRDLTHTAQEAFQKVRDRNFKGLTKEEKARYEKTVAAFD